MTSDLAVGVAILAVCYLGLVAAVVHGKIQIERIARGEGPVGSGRERDPGVGGGGAGKSSGHE